MADALDPNHFVLLVADRTKVMGLQLHLISVPVDGPILTRMPPAADE
jgi:hypothetical protein